MTLHAAKGLEFPVVFITGCEEGLIPYQRNKDGETDEAEERRLFYVGLTRAKRKVFLTHAQKRLLFGTRLNPDASSFLKDIARDLKRHEKPFAGKPRAEVQLCLFK
jgi:superfamily I DNA/RNA helicase